MWLRSQFLWVTLVLYEVFVPHTRLFCDYFIFSPFHGMLLSLSLDIFELSSYSQIGSSMIAWSVPTSYVGLVRGVGASHGPFGVRFIVCFIYV